MDRPATVCDALERVEGGTKRLQARWSHPKRAVMTVSLLAFASSWQTSLMCDHMDTDEAHMVTPVAMSILRAEPKRTDLPDGFRTDRIDEVHSGGRSTLSPANSLVCRTELFDGYAERPPQPIFYLFVGDSLAALHLFDESLAKPGLEREVVLCPAPLVAPIAEEPLIRRDLDDVGHAQIQQSDNPRQFVDLRGDLSLLPPGDRHICRLGHPGKLASRNAGRFPPGRKHVRAKASYDPPHARSPGLLGVIVQNDAAFHLVDQQSWC